MHVLADNIYSPFNLRYVWKKNWARMWTHLSKISQNVKKEVFVVNVFVFVAVKRVLRVWPFNQQSRVTHDCFKRSLSNIPL